MSEQITNLLHHPKRGFKVIVEKYDRIKDLEQKDTHAFVYIAFRTDLDWRNCFYIGFGSRWNKHIWRNRFCTHKDDLFNSLLDENAIIKCLIGLTVEEAHVLEAYYIKEAVTHQNLILSKPKSVILELNHIANKRRERQYERAIDNYNYLLPDGGNPFTFAYR